MEVSDALIRDCTRRIMLSRMRILCNNGFYGLLLMHAKMAIGDQHETAWVEDGERIVFNPGFINPLSDSELDYVMMHQILHIVLEHLGRMKSFSEDTIIYDVAADIVVNSNILRSCGGNLQSISLETYGGEQMHKAPDGSEGWTHTVEELYEMFQHKKGKSEDDNDQNRGGWDYHQHEQERESDGDVDKQSEKESRSNREGEEQPDVEVNGEGKEQSNKDREGQPSGQSESQSDKDGKSNKAGKDRPAREGEGQSSGENKRRSDRDGQSNKDGKDQRGREGEGQSSGNDEGRSDKDGQSNKDGKGQSGKDGKDQPGREGDGQSSGEGKGRSDKDGQSNKDGKGRSGKDGKDQPGREGDGQSSGEGKGQLEEEQESRSKKEAKREFWKACVLQAAEAIAARKILENSTEWGSIPGFAERYIEEIKRPQTDWRTVLDEFIQEDIVDYSFTPPDRRFGDSPFFLPDFNEKDDRIEKVLFMIDTSGSMSDKTVTMVYSEVRGAIEQFGGKLEGWLGFFDACVVEPQAFSNVEEFEIIRPQGGGGTSFEEIFKYVNENMSMENIMSIVILTDGYAPFPNESETHDTPVLWIITNEAVTPPWGKVARVQP